MNLSTEQLSEIATMRAEASTNAELQEQLVDFLVDRSTSLYLQAASCETPLATIPTACFATYVEETVKHLCGPRGQNRRSLRMLAEIFVLTTHSIGRLHMESGSVGSPQELQVKCSLAAALTAEARRLAAAIESMRADIEAHACNAQRKGEKRPRKAARGKKEAVQSKLGGKAKVRRFDAEVQDDE